MSTAYTDLLGFALPVTGELSGTWGDVVNNSITELVEDSIAATATASVTSGDWTLTTTGGGVHNQARCAIIIPTGTPGVTRNVIAPAQSKAYVVMNQSDASIIFKSSLTTGVTIPAGKKSIVAWNGSDFVAVVEGNVSGPASSTDNAIARFDGSTGKYIQNSTAILSDTGEMSISELRLLDGGGVTYAAFAPPASLVSSYTLTMPADFGTSNQVLSTNGAGTLFWATVSGGGGMVYPGAGIPVSTGSAWGVSKGTPTGDIVGTSDSQTLTNKTIGLNGALTANNNVIQTIKTATFNSQTTISTTSGSIAVDWSSAQNQKQTSPTGSITYTFTPPPGPCHLQLIIDSGGQTITWPGNVVWLVDTWSGVNGKKAAINFWYDGSSYFAIGSNQV